MSLEIVPITLRTANAFVTDYHVDDVPYCPNCKCSLPEVSYCEECGQAIDWEVSE